MRKALRIIGKSLCLLVGVVFLLLSVFEFLILIRGETSLFENQAAGTWLYLIRGIASLCCFLLALSLILFPKEKRPLANLLASSSILVIVAFSYLLMEIYVYMPLLILAIVAMVAFATDFILTKRNK